MRSKNQNERRMRKNYYLEADDPAQNDFQRASNVTSFVWSYFKKDINTDYRVLCTLCNLVMYINSSNTTQMISHLKSIHEIDPHTSAQVTTTTAMKAQQTKEQHLRKSAILPQNNLPHHAKETQVFYSSESSANNKQCGENNQNVQFNQDWKNQQQHGTANTNYETQQMDQINRPNRVRIVEPRKQKKLRGPRGPYKKTSHSQNKEGWEASFRSAYESINRFHEEHKELRCADNQVRFKPIPQSNEFVVVQKVNNQIRRQVKNYIRSLPYYLKLSEITLSLLKAYSFTPGVCHSMIKKYHWAVTLNDKKCINKIKTYYRHDLFIKYKRMEAAKGGSTICNDAQSESESNNQNGQADPQRSMQSFESESLNYKDSEYPDWDNQPKEKPDSPEYKPDEFLQNNQQSMVLLCTAKMRDNYRKYGSVVRLVKFSNFINSRSPTTTIIYFIGQDCSAKMVLFGVLLLKWECYENYREGFQYFFTIMGHAPKVIIRERDSGCKDMIVKAILDVGKQIRKNIRVISHYNTTDVLQIIQGFESNLDKTYAAKIKTWVLLALNQVCLVKKQKYLQLIREEVNKIQGSSVISQESKLSMTMNKLEQIISATQVTIPSPVGFNLEIQRALKAVQILQPGILDRECLSKFIMFFFDLEFRINSQGEMCLGELSREGKIQYYQRLFKKNGVDFDAFDDYQELYELRNELSPFIYYKLVSSFITALRHTKKVPTCSPLHYLVKPRRSLQQPQCMVSYSVQKDCWECNCHLEYWTGLPCVHLLRLVISFGGSISYYVDSRWKVNDVEGRSRPSEQAEDEDFHAFMEASHKCLYQDEQGLLRSQKELEELFWSFSY